jgi:hypothetical protein
MKLKLLLLFCVFALQGFSQSFINPTARWIQSYTWYGATANTNCNYEYYINGDSTFNGTMYYKMYRMVNCTLTQFTYDSLGNQVTIVTNNLDTTFDRLLREVNHDFYVLGFDSIERRMYNFNVHDFLSFDSIIPYTTCYPSNASILIHDTVCIGSEQRKRWQVSMTMYPAAYSYIEGVGPSSGFDAPICRSGCPECGYGLQYFILNNDTLYHGNCMSTAGLQNTSQREPIFSQQANILNITHAQLQQVAIYAMNGKLVTQFSAIHQSALPVNTDALASGLYLLKVMANNQVFTKKIIVQP